MQPLSQAVARGKGLTLQHVRSVPTPQIACLANNTHCSSSLCSKRRSANHTGTPSERLEVCQMSSGVKLEQLMAADSIAGRRDAERDVGFPADRFGETPRRLGDRESHWGRR
jgi:hypothetical protein